MGRILHLSADYPDPLVPQKTKAISNLLAMVPDHGHVVYSLNRTNGWRHAIQALAFSDAVGDGHRAVAYRAPPKGIFLVRHLSALAKWIGDDLADRGLVPDAIHAHKLSIEGLIAEHLADRLHVPVVLSIQGNTDLKIVRARRDLQRRYRQIWQGAAFAFPFAPWAGAGLDALLGPRRGPTQPLPCPGPAEATLPPKVVGPVFRTAFHFRDAANKNAAALIRALGLAAREVPDIRLEIIGGGDARAFNRLIALANDEAPGRVRFLGNVPNREVQSLFNSSCGFAMVSHRESFGMVFSEALQAGCPCLYPRGRAISGYFVDGSVVVSADPGSFTEIASGFVRLAREEQGFKSRLGQMMNAGGLDFLKSAAIAATYRNGLETAMESPGQRPV